MPPTLGLKLGYKLRRVIFKVSPQTAEKLNIDFAFDAPNRTFLEKDVFGYLNCCFGSPEKNQKLLFIGLDKHNWHYHRLLHMQLHSIDIKAKNMVYGQPGQHTVGSATQLPNYYETCSFDAVIANGLIGFGLNCAEQFDQLLHGTYHVLKPGGILILGYNNTPERLKFEIDAISNWSRFELFVPDIPGVTSPYHPIDDSFRHTYVFLRKPAH